MNTPRIFSTRSYAYMRDAIARHGKFEVGEVEFETFPGARSVAAITTHGVFPADALARLKASGLFTQIICTDTHPRAVALKSDFLQVESVAELLSQYL